MLITSNDICMMMPCACSFGGPGFLLRSFGVQETYEVAAKSCVEEFPIWHGLDHRIKLSAPDSALEGSAA